MHSKKLRRHDAFAAILKQGVQADEYRRLKAAESHAPHPVQEKLAEYAAGRLPEADAEVIRKHLLFCPRCVLSAAGYMRNQPLTVILPKPIAATEYWQPEYAGLQATAADIPQQAHTFVMEEGDIHLECNWGGPQGSDPAYIWLKWEANLSTEREFWAQFINPVAQTIRYEVCLGTYLLGEETFTSQELGFDPSTEQWAVAIVLKEVSDVMQE